MSVLPDGLSPLFRPAAALPASLLMPVLGLVPVALPVVVPLVDGAVAVPLVAAPPVPELPPAEPLPDCASAKLLENASAVANPKIASFMTAPFCCAWGKRDPPDRVPVCRSQIVAVPLKVAAGPQVWNHSDIFVSIHN